MDLRNSYPLDTMRLPFALAFVASALAPHVAAQFDLATLRPSEIHPDLRLGSELGTAACRLADLDGDGHPEWMISAPSHGSVTQSYRGLVTIHSGSDQQRLRTHDGDVQAEFLGSSLAAMDDIDGDGVGDYAIGSWGYNGTAGTSCGRVQVFAGATGHLLYAVQGTTAQEAFGMTLLRLDDLDADGRDDYAVGSPFFTLQGSRRGKITILSGATGQVLRSIPGVAAGGLLGRQLGRASDLDGDGLADLLAGSPFEGSIGAIRSYSSATGLELVRALPTAETQWMGETTGGLDDIDGDGVDDFFGADVGFHVTAASGTLSRAGRLSIYSGVTGQELLAIEGQHPFGFFGRGAHAIEDRDGDGLRDLLTFGSTGLMDQQRLAVHSSRTGALLHEYRIPGRTTSSSGMNLAIGADLDRDGWNDWIVSNHRWPDSHLTEGRVQIISGAPVIGTNTSCGVTASPQAAGIVMQGSDSLAVNEVVLHAFPLPYETFGYFLTCQSTQLGPYFGGWRPLCLGGAPIGRYAHQVIATGPHTNWADQVVDLTSLPGPTGSVTAAIGETHYFQCWFRTPHGSDFTDVVGVTLQ